MGESSGKSKEKRRGGTDHFSSFQNDGKTFLLGRGQIGASACLLRRRLPSSEPRRAHSFERKSEASRRRMQKRPLKYVRQYVREMEGSWGSTMGNPIAE